MVVLNQEVRVAMATAKKKTTMKKGAPKAAPKAAPAASSAAKPAFGTPAWRAKYMKKGGK